MTTNTPSNLDYLSFIQDNCKITDWEAGFCTSCIQWLEKREGNKLSAKQLVIVDRMVAQYLEEADTDEIVGWYENSLVEEPDTEETVLNATAVASDIKDPRDDMASRYTPSQRPPPVEDYDDDIPF